LFNYDMGTITLIRFLLADQNSAMQQFTSDYCK